MEKFKKAAVAAILCVVMVAGFTGIALANGTITGYFYQNDGKTPLAGMSVCALLTSGTGGYPSIPTTASGSYSISVP